MELKMLGPLRDGFGGLGKVERRTFKTFSRGECRSGTLASYGEWICHAMYDESTSYLGAVERPRRSAIELR